MQTSNLLIPIVSVATKDLTAAELAALNEAAQTGRDPHSISSYAQVSDLFTEDGGRRVPASAGRSYALSSHATMTA